MQAAVGEYVPDMADLLGKAGPIRTVPVPAWVKAAIVEWKEPSGINQGALFRSISKTGHVWGNRMTPKALWEIVREAASGAGTEKLAPHDLRRTCARLCFAEHPSSFEQTSKLRSFLIPEGES